MTARTLTDRVPAGIHGCHVVESAKESHRNTLRVGLFPGGPVRKLCDADSSRYEFGTPTSLADLWRALFTTCALSGESFGRDSAPVRSR
ncbi:hypothetical protein T31B1_06015 [Salinisphaera sp. T31B1]